MKVHPIFSSSQGNCCVVYTDNTKILLDVGVSWKKATNASHLDNLDAIFCSHSHGDHISGAGIAGRKTGKTIYLPREAFEKKAELFTKCKIKYITGGDVTTVGDFSVLSVSTRHDTKNSLAFIVEEIQTGKRFGLLTDTGSISKVIRIKFSDCNGYLIETDYDPQLLLDFPDYDEYLKERISSPWGHLSTDQAIEFIQENLNLDKIDWILLGHISQNTNTPELVLEKIYKAFPDYKEKFTCAPTAEPYEL